VFLDIKMPQMDGMEVLKAIKSDESSPPVVILSGHGTVATAVEATKLGAYDFIEKPPDRERLLLVARNAISQRKLTEENRRLKLSFDERYKMEGESVALQKVWDAVRRAAPTNATVLITGESGVGKELVARAIHRNSNRRDEAFIQVNCAAIPGRADRERALRATRRARSRARRRSRSASSSSRTRARSSWTRSGT
jgi:two-component system nitrogen regulation response regulator NtrX